MLSRGLCRSIPVWRTIYHQNCGRVCKASISTASRLCLDRASTKPAAPDQMVRTQTRDSFRIGDCQVPTPLGQRLARRRAAPKTERWYHKRAHPLCQSLRCPQGFIHGYYSMSIHQHVKCTPAYVYHTTPCLPTSAHVCPCGPIGANTIHALNITSVPW